MNVNNLNHQKNIKNLEGSFGVEGINISKATRKSLELLKDGTYSHQEIKNKTIKKYTAVGR